MEASWRDDDPSKPLRRSGPGLFPSLSLSLSLLSVDQHSVVHKSRGLHDARRIFAEYDLVHQDWSARSPRLVRTIIGRSSTLPRDPVVSRSRTCNETPIVAAGIDERTRYVRASTRERGADSRGEQLLLPHRYRYTPSRSTRATPMFHLAYHCRELRDALRHERRGSSGVAARQWIRVSGGGKEERPLEHRERSGAECERWDGRIEE